MQIAGLDPGLTALSVGRNGRARWLSPAVAVVVLLATLLVVRHLAMEVRPAEIGAAIKSMPLWRIGAALGLTVLSYLALTLYDWFALRTIGKPLPWKIAAGASFTSFTLSHNLGFGLVTGGSARVRAYTAAGLSVADAARITLLASLNFWAGIIALLALALAAAGYVHPAFHVPIHRGLQHGLLLSLIALLAIPPALRASGVKKLSVGALSVQLPSLPVMAAQLLVSLVDLACASMALLVLTQAAAPVPLTPFLLAYALGLVLSLVSHVPGGVGVFEATMLGTFPGDPGRMLGALILYRSIYYILPLGLTGLVMLFQERRQMSGVARGALLLTREAARMLTPTIMAALVFAGGLILLLSGALPPIQSRLHLLSGMVPLPFIEASHFSASIAGTALLLLAPALQARLRSGFLLARLFLLTGALFSLMKGVDYEEATVLLAVAGLLQAGQSAFYRSSGLAGARRNEWWWAAAAAVAASAWVGLMAYQHVSYTSDLWWDFAWHGDAPRFLRSTLGAAILVCVFGLWRLTTAPVSSKAPAALPEAVARTALARTGRTDAMLAFTGDKSFLISGSGDAFLMYRRSGRSLVVMGDPVGAPESWADLMWRARRECDRTASSLCFYQASARLLPLLVEVGLQPMKYGEEACIDLTRFSLEGSRRRSLRHCVKRAIGAGVSFEMVPAERVPALIPELKSVSDAWLAHKKTGEKGFSLGRFDPAYLERFNCALLRHEGRIIAFANILETPNHEELSVDLMRHRPGAPYGAMNLLFVRLMQWGAEQGFERFNLGVAPLSGLSGGRLAPLWSRAGAALYHHGERFYGFTGLRTFKDSFGPNWEPRYIAAPQGFRGWRALVEIAALVKGSARRAWAIVRRRGFRPAIFPAI